MCDTLTRLTEVLARFENPLEPLSEDEVGKTLREFSRALTDAGKAVPMRVRAEAIAFTFMENYASDASGWGPTTAPWGRSRTRPASGCTLRPLLT